jgi:hypothetical protein
MHSFLVIVQNLKLAPSDMLELCPKNLLRMFNYAPCPHIITLPLFSSEQNLISQNPNMFQIILYDILACP